MMQYMSRRSSPTRKCERKSMRVSLTAYLSSSSTRQHPVAVTVPPSAPLMAPVREHDHAAHDVQPL